jgi:putative transposase
MGVTGDSHDNALMETMFLTLRSSWCTGLRDESRDEAENAIFAYMDGPGRPSRRLR